MGLTKTIGKLGNVAKTGAQKAGQAVGSAAKEGFSKAGKTIREYDYKGAVKTGARAVGETTSKLGEYSDKAASRGMDYAEHVSGKTKDSVFLRGIGEDESHEHAENMLFGKGFEAQEHHGGINLLGAPKESRKKKKHHSRNQQKVVVYVGSPQRRKKKSKTKFSLI